MGQGRAVRVLVGLVLGVPACRDVAAPFGAPPYLAIVTQVAAPSPAAIGTDYRYRVREASGTLGIDTVVVAAPSDTVILPLPPATYVVELSGFPPVCKARNAGRTAIVIAPNTNTSIVRYFVACQSQLSVTVTTEASSATDSLYVYHLSASDGSERVGLLRATDTLLLFHLPEGSAVFDLADVAANCDVTNDGGASRRIMVDSAGGAELDFRVTCSDPSRRPRLLWARTGYHDGVGGLVFRVADPDRDLRAFAWDLTDCRRTSILPGGPRLRGGLGSGRTANQDTVTAISAFEVGLPDSAARRACATVWVTDDLGNMSTIVELPLDTIGGTPPVATLFNAHFAGTERLRTDLAVADPDEDFLGVFAAVRLRDGVLGPPDGRPDMGYFNTSGFLGATVPDVPIGTGRLTYDNFYAVILYLFDGQGRFSRVEDADLFH